MRAVVAAVGLVIAAPATSVPLAEFCDGGKTGGITAIVETWDRLAGTPADLSEVQAVLESSDVEARLCIPRSLLIYSQARPGRIAALRGLIPVLAKTLSDESDDVRMAGADALRLMRPLPQSISPALLAMAESGGKTAVSAINTMAALERLPGEAKGHLVQLVAEGHSNSAPALVTLAAHKACEDGMLPVLFESLTDGEPAVKTAAMMLLGAGGCQPEHVLSMAQSLLESRELDTPTRGLVERLVRMLSASPGSGEKAEPTPG